MKDALYSWVAGCLLATAAVSAQESRSDSPSSTRYQTYPYSGDGYGYGWGYGASTVEEGYRRGLADMIRSRALYNQLTADAAARLQDARRMYLESYKESVETYYRTRDLIKAKRAEEHAKRRERTAAWLRHRQSRDPPGLGESQLDRATGKIQWPKTLMEESYAGRRENVEAVFAGRAEQGEPLSPDDAVTIRKHSDSMLDELKRQVRELPPMDYMIAKRFIESLAVEAGLPSG